MGEKQQKYISRVGENEIYKLLHPLQGFIQSVKHKRYPGYSGQAIYFQMEQHARKMYENSYKVNVSRDAYKLDIFDFKLNIQQFLKYDWSDIQCLTIVRSKLTNEDWQLIVKNAKIAFKNVKWIWIPGNQISRIKQGDLQNFPSLQRIDFRAGTQNPLTKQSKLILDKFQQNHPEILIRY